MQTTSKLMNQNEASRLHGYFKMKALHKVVFVLLLAMTALVACTNKKTVFIPAESSIEKGSVVYVYRPSKTTNVMQIPKVSITGAIQFAIASDEYKMLYLKPGKHAVRLHEIKGNTAAVDHELMVHKGQVHYLRVDAEMKFEVGQGYQPYQRSFGLTEVSSELAKVEIAGVKDMDGRKVKRGQKVKQAGSSTDEVVEEEEATFSVDRTLNPFNH